MQELSYLHELGDELVVITTKPQETSNLSDSGRVRPSPNSIYITFICCYSLSRDSTSQICDLPLEQLTFGRLKFQLSLLQFLEHGPQPLKMAGQICQKIIII